MRNYSTKNKANAHRSDSGEIQAKVDLQRLAREFLGEGMPGGTGTAYLNPFNPDDGEGTFLVFKTHYWDVRTGDRGSALKFIMRMRRCSYANALAFLEGWILASEMDRV